MQLHDTIQLDDIKLTCIKVHPPDNLLSSETLYELETSELGFHIQNNQINYRENVNMHFGEEWGELVYNNSSMSEKHEKQNDLSINNDGLVLVHVKPQGRRVGHILLTTLVLMITERQLKKLHEGESMKPEPTATRFDPTSSERKPHWPESAVVLSRWISHEHTAELANKGPLRYDTVVLEKKGTVTLYHHSSAADDIVQNGYKLQENGDHLTIGNGLYSFLKPYQVEGTNPTYIKTTHTGVWYEVVYYNGDDDKSGEIFVNENINQLKFEHVDPKEHIIVPDQEAVPKDYWKDQIDPFADSDSFQ